jgi:transposase
MLTVSRQQESPRMAEKRPRGRPPSEPRTSLERWFVDTGTSYADVAKRFGISTSHLKHVARGIERPSQLLCAALEMLTEGKITAQEIRAYIGDDDPAPAR